MVGNFRNNGIHQGRLPENIEKYFGRASVGHLPAAASEQFIESQKIHARVHCGGRRPVSHFLNNCSKVFVETHPPEVFYKKGVINSLAKFTGNTKT